MPALARRAGRPQAQGIHLAARGNPERGSTQLSSAIATDPLADEITTCPGVHTANATLTGTPHRPTLALLIHAEHQADLSDIRHRLHEHALPRLRQALDVDELPTTVEFRFTPTSPGHAPGWVR